MRDTPYATELNSAAITFPTGGEGRIERLRFKTAPTEGQEGYRFSWWKEGRMIQKPLDLTEEQLLELLSNAIEGGVFSTHFLAELREMLM